jgi:hypothetical protein
MRVCWPLSVVIAAGIGCAGGAEPNAGPITTTFGSATQSTTTPASDTSEGGSESESGDASGSDESTLDPASSSGDGESAESSTTMPDPTTAEASSDDGMPTPECPNETICANAEVVGMVSGDEDSDPIDVGGSDSTWLTFQVTEDNDSAFGESVSFTATLTSPPGTDFDLYVYRGAVNGQTGCGGVMDSSTAAVGVDVVHMSWGEGGVANGGDDRAWVAVEIIPKGQMCPDGGQWSLSVDGDT